MLIAVVLSTPAAAQSASTITGRVFDSVANAPIEGAVVQVVRVDSEPTLRSDSALRVFTAVSDVSGRYQIAGLPRGMFGVGFQHNSLIALGLESPLRALQIGSDTTLVVDLAIPAGAQVRADRCPASQVADGMLAGFVLDASRGTTVRGASVALGWVEIGVVEKQLRAMPKRMTTTVGDDGAFIACGVAGGAPLTIEVRQTGYHPIVGEIQVPEGGVLRRDFFLADTSSESRKAAIVGRLVYADGAPVSSGQISIATLDIDVAVENGAFSIPGVPPGTWLVEARAIGYEPKSIFIDVAEGTPYSMNVELGRRVQVLEAMNVVAKQGRDAKALREIAERRLVSGGTQFLPGNVWLTSALQQSDVLRAAKGFRYLGPDEVVARGCPDFGVKLGLGGAFKDKRLVVYLDGQRYPAGFAELKNEVTMQDVLAIEAYPDFMTIPPIWRTKDACAVVAVWTRH